MDAQAIKAGFVQFGHVVVEAGKRFGHWMVEVTKQIWARSLPFLAIAFSGLRTGYGIGTITAIVGLAATVGACHVNNIYGRYILGFIAATCAFLSGLSFAQRAVAVI